MHVTGGEQRAHLWARGLELGERSGGSLMANPGAYPGGLPREPAAVVLEPQAG